MWRSTGGALFPGIDLGPFQELIRLFLLGGGFPQDIVVLVAVWPLRDVLPGAHTPRAIKINERQPYRAYNFYIPGFEFKLMVGKQIPEADRETCSHASAEHFIYANVGTVDLTLKALHGLAKRGREARKLREFREALNADKKESGLPFLSS